MAGRVRQSPTPKKKSKAQFMGLDNSVCCGGVFSSYAEALEEAKGHLEDRAMDCGPGIMIEGWKIVQVISELSAEVTGVTITETKV